MKREILWKAALAELELDTSKASFNAWLKQTGLLSVERVGKERQIVKINCRTLYQQSMVETRFYGQIKKVLDRITEKQNELVFVVQVEMKKDEAPVGPLFQQEVTGETSSSAHEKAVERVRLRPDYIFDTFAVSSTNEMAHAAASAVAREPGKAYHLLFLYGGVGVGKTHLMNAVGIDILRQNPEAEMLLCSGEQFMNELVAAIQSKRTGQFKAKYRKIKVLLVDDIQFIAGKDAVQEEFFHTFNAIVQNQGQIVLTSDKLPEEMVLLEDRLRSRFEGGLTIDIQEPNYELRTAILNIKAKARGIRLPADVAGLIASKVTSTRRLEGVLMQLATRTNAREEDITPDVAKKILGLDTQKHSEKPQRYINPQEIIDAVAEYFSIKANLIKGKKRTKEVVEARHMVMLILRNDLEIPLKEVGRIMGGRDHTTVMHAVDKMEKVVDSSERHRGDYASVKKRVLG